MEDTTSHTDDVGISPDQLAAAKVLATRGLHPGVVAQSIDVSIWDLSGPHAAAFDEAATIRAKNVMSSALYEMAASKQNTSATIFWVKSYGHPPTTPPLVSAGKPEKQKPYVWNPNDPNDRVIFSVYNNDGEPNHDY